MPYNDPFWSSPDMAERPKQQLIFPHQLTLITSIISIMNRNVIFVLTVLCSGAFNGQMTVFSMIKKPLSDEFQLTESYLGLLDAITQIGNIIGNSLLLMFPLRQPKRAYFIATTLFCLISLSLIIGRVLDSARNIVFCIIVFSMGFLKAPVFFPTFIMGRHFDPQTQSFQVNLWIALVGLGEGFPILFGQFIMHTLNLNWAIFLLISCSFLFAVAFLLFFYVAETPAEHPESSSFCEALKEKVEKVKEIFSESARGWLIVEVILTEGMFYNVLLWYPFYFSLISYEQYAFAISVIFSINIVAGTFAFEALLDKCPSSSNRLIIGSFALFVFLQGCLLLVNRLGQSQGQGLVYFILSGCSGLFLGGPYSRITSSQSIDAANGDSSDLYYILAIENVLTCVPLILFSLAIGYFMQRDQNSFFVILLINSLIILVIDVGRRVTRPNPVESQLSQSSE